MTNMAPLRGWAARGKRLIGKAPRAPESDEFRRSPAP